MFLTWPLETCERALNTQIDLTKATCCTLFQWYKDYDPTTSTYKDFYENPVKRRKLPCKRNFQNGTSFVCALSEVFQWIFKLVYGKICKVLIFSKIIHTYYMHTSATRSQLRLLELHNYLSTNLDYFRVLITLIV